ncbi:MAG: polyprenol monophosphomannose synthase [Minisyncoccia bacterium]
MQKTIILIPTYNERENVELLIPEIFALHADVHVLIIDDSSPDGTGEFVRSLMKSYPNLSMLSRPGKQGLGEAYKAGMTQVLKDPDVTAIMTMDADGSHAAEYIADLRKAGETNDMVIGSRYTRGGGIENWERWRYFLSRWGNFYARTITGLPIRDMTAGFMHIRADVLRKIDFLAMRASGYAFLMELKFRIARTLQGSVVEVPIMFKSRRGGESKISNHIIREGLKTPWLIRFKR